MNGVLRHLRRWSPANLPLRVTLVGLVLLVMVAGLIASGVAVTSAMRSDLIGRTDSGLRDAVGGWARPAKVHDETSPQRPPNVRRPPSQYYVSTTMPDGRVLVFNDFSSAPDLSGLSEGDLGPITVDSVGSGPKWRVIQRSGDNGVSTVAVPLTDVDATVTRLIWLQLGVGLMVLALLGVASYLLVRNSLRPLRRVEETAHAIADGDLHQRVPVGPPNTEVGSLGRSVNTMLGQIQRSFAVTELSEQQARASEEKMRRFVADASHELRTPLTSIKGFAELLTLGETVDRRDAIARISAEADRMNLLVEDLLMLARLDAQRPLEREAVDLLALAVDAVAAARAAAPERSIEVVLSTPEAAVVVGDATRLTQVLRNIIGNAIAHTPANASITVDVGSVGDEVLVSVRDTGPGISPEIAEHIFERFYRGDESRHRGGSAGGSGLGLSIVAALIAAHGGRVGVESTPGAGARFWFALPRAE